VKTHTGASSNPYRFTGELNDSTVARSPYYLRARYYDPAIGRFQSRDPWPANPMNPQSLDRYAYVLNNPANLIDPFGLDCRMNPLHWGSCAGDAADWVGNKAEDSREPAILTLDVAAVCFEGTSAVVTDTAAVAGCFFGPEGCAAGYALGWTFTTPFRVTATIAGVGSAVLTTTKGDPKESAISWGTVLVGSLPKLAEPNVGTAAAAYQLCRDLGRCGP
jgi:RHS repeat-associated protein